MDQIKIGKFIAELRKEKKLTQEELAVLLGVSNKSVSRWENGKNLPHAGMCKAENQEREQAIFSCVGGVRLVGGGAVCDAG